MNSTTLVRPPPGVISDWSDAGWAVGIEAECIVLLVLNTLCTILRLYTRIHVLRNFGIDDFFCILAYGMSTVTLAWQFVAIHYGFGRHIWNIPKENARGLFKSFFMLQLLPGPTYLFIKLTLLLTYARILKPVIYMRWLIWSGVIVCVGFYTGIFFNTLFSCSPVAKAWNPYLHGKCEHEAIPGSPTGIFNVITDTYICVLPLPLVWHLNMSWKRKLKLLSVLSLGVFTVSASIVRLVETVVQNGKVDFTYHYGFADIFANLEYSVGLMVACMLVYPALWDRVLRKSFSAYRARLSSVYQSVFSFRSERLGSRSSDNDKQLAEINSATIDA